MEKYFKFIKDNMKPTSSFRMTKANKTVLSHILDPHKRGAIKRDLIKAQLMSEIKVKSSKEDRKSQPE